MYSDSPTLPDLADPREVAAILGGRHQDPFDFLGMHRLDGSLVVRLCAPEARQVEVLDGEGVSVVRLQRIDPAGFFVGRFDRRVPFPYRF